MWGYIKESNIGQHFWYRAIWQIWSVGADASNVVKSSKWHHISRLFSLTSVRNMPLLTGIHEKPVMMLMVAHHQRLCYVKGGCYWWGYGRWTTTRMEIDGWEPVPSLPPSLPVALLHANIRRNIALLAALMWLQPTSATGDIKMAV